MAVEKENKNGKYKEGESVGKGDVGESGFSKNKTEKQEGKKNRQLKLVARFRTFVYSGYDVIFFF